MESKCYNRFSLEKSPVFRPIILFQALSIDDAAVNSLYLTE